MVRLRPITTADEAVIERWPPYAAEFADIDYALREGGWLAEFRDRADTWRYAAEEEGKLVAFSLLSVMAAGEAEFRIALRPDMAGRGLGAIVAARTLEAGFGEHGLARIHLVVRKANPRAFHLYRRLGFVLTGECCLTVNHLPTPFFQMELRRHDWPALPG